MKIYKSNRNCRTSEIKLFETVILLCLRQIKVNQNTLFNLSPEKAIINVKVPDYITDLHVSKIESV